MILISYDRDQESGLWSFSIRQDGIVRARTEPQFKTMKGAKRLVGELTKVIKNGRHSDEEIRKIINN